MKEHSFLDDRGVLTIQGEDRYSFLQGLITNDIKCLTNSPALYTAKLNPQGKYLVDFFVIQAEDQLLLDVEKDKISLLLRYFTLYKLKSRVTITDLSHHYKIAVFLDDSLQDRDLKNNLTISQSFFYKDPRLPVMGWRGLVHSQDEDLIENCTSSSLYRLHRLKQGVAEGGQELIPDKSIILEYGFDSLHAIAWEKGCYLGQELMARTKHRGMVHKRIFPIESNNSLPSAGTLILLNDQKIGEIRQTQGRYGLALFRCLPEESLQELQNRLDRSNYPVTVKEASWWIK